MTRLCFLVLVSVVACGTGTNALKSFEDSFLGFEESLLRFDDSVGERVPLALQSQRVPLPLLRALISRDVIQHGMAGAGILPTIIASRHQLHLLVRDQMLFQHMIKEIGKSVLQEAIKKKDEDRVFTFAAPMAASIPLEYLGERGTLKGFLIDLINAVCEAAGKRCVVQQTEMTNCFTHQKGERLIAGKGLLAKQFDMCMTWFKTDERAILVSFSKPYWRLNDLAFFIVKKGNPDKFDPRNITGEQLGFLFGHSSSPVCLRTSRNVIGAEDFPDQKAVFIDAQARVESKHYDKLKVKAFFIYTIEGFFNADELENVGEPIHCGGGGELHGVTRKDNELPWFDDTLTKTKEDGRYYDLCRKTEERHGGKPACV